MFANPCECISMTYFFAFVVTVTFVYVCVPIVSEGNVSSVSALTLQGIRATTAPKAHSPAIKIHLKRFLFINGVCTPSKSPSAGARNMPDASLRTSFDNANGLRDVSLRSELWQSKPLTATTPKHTRETWAGHWTNW